MTLAEAFLKKPNRDVREFGMGIYYHCFAVGNSTFRQRIINNHITHIGSGDVCIGILN